MSEDDEFGAPISWRVLEPHTTVYADGGIAVGVVRHVMALESEDIFDGIVVHTHDGDRFVPGEQIGALHERAVALKLTEEEVGALGRPEPGPAVMAVDSSTLTDKHLHNMRNIASDAWHRLNGH